MPALLLALALCAAEAPADDEPTAAVFTAPTPVLLHASAVVNQLIANVFVPFGVTFSTGETEWSIDSAALVIDGSHVEQVVGPTRYFGFWLAAGPVFRLSGQALHGFFLAPKVTLGLFAFNAPGSPLADLLVGADVGYRFTRGRLYCAFVVGASVGVGLSESDAVAGPWLGVFSTVRNTQTPQPVFGLNLDVFRIGVTL